MAKLERFLVSIAVMGVLGVSSIVYAQPAGDFSEEEAAMIKQRKQHRANMQAKLKEELGLTDEQVKQLDQQRNQHQGKIKEYSQTMQKLREEMTSEIEKTEIDEVKIQAINEQVKSVQNKIADYRLDGILQLRKILTPEQFKKFYELKEQRKGGRGKMQEMRGRMNQGDSIGE